MVSIKGVTASQASSYYEKRDDRYYSKEGNSEIYGKGAENLCISGSSDSSTFRMLLDGQNPKGEQLIKVAPNGEHRAGLDITFSAPKSVSILNIFDDRFKEAHQRAVKEAIDYAQSHFAQARNTHDGITEKLDTDNLIAVLFLHNTSRELDPQLHTHSVIMNMTQREDDQWRALSNERFFDGKMELGQAYRNALAKIITQELGYAITNDHKGLFEIKGVDKDLLKAFSSRSGQIEDMLPELRNLYPNVPEQKLREWATLGSREPKRNVNIDEVRQEWEQRLQVFGYTKDTLLETIEKASDKTQSVKISAEDAIRNGSFILTQQESTFTRGQLLREAGKLSIGKEDFVDLEKALDDKIANAEFLQRDKDTLTTMEMLRIESGIVKLVQNGKDQVKAILDSEIAQKRIHEKESELKCNGNNILKYGQKEAIEHILTSRDRVIGIQGDAGTGKTFTLGIAMELARDETKFRGLAFTGIAKSELEAVGIPSSTLHSFLSSSEKTLGLVSGKETWIVDEASMVGSRQIETLLNRAKVTDSRVVFIGDTKQLQAIDAGNMFRQLQDRQIFKTARMNDVVRQANSPAYLDLVNDISSKRIDRAFQKLENGKLLEIPDRSQRLEEVVRDYSDGAHLSKILVISRNADRNELNSLIREELRTLEKLSGQEHIFTVRESKSLNPIDKHFAGSYSEGNIIFTQKAGVIGRAGTEAKITSVDYDTHSITIQTKDSKFHQISLAKDGDKISTYSEKQQSFTTNDKVVFLKNDRLLGVSNGTTGLIKDIDENGNIKASLDNDKELSLNIKHYPYIDHGYAVTDYKSQGQTAREVIIYTDTTHTGNTYNSFYVATTRGKDEVKVYTDNALELKNQVKLEKIKTSTLDFDNSSSRSASPHMGDYRLQEQTWKDNLSDSIPHDQEPGMAGKEISLTSHGLETNQTHNGRDHEL